MDRYYIIFGSLICCIFVWFGSTGVLIFDFAAEKSSKPNGPGQHFHK